MEDLVPLYSQSEAAALHPYAVAANLGLTDTEEVFPHECLCLVVLKRLNGLLLCLPKNSIAGDALHAAQNAGPDEVLGPSVVLEVPAVSMDMFSFEADLQDLTVPMPMIEVLLVDVSASFVENFKELIEVEEVGNLFTYVEGEVSTVPHPEILAEKALAWVQQSEADGRAHFYSAEEEVPETPIEEAAPSAKAIAKTKAAPKLRGGLPGGLPGAKKRPTVAALSDSLDQVAKAVQALPALAQQVQALAERTERLEGGSPAQPSPSTQPAGSFPMRGLGTTPPLSSFVQRMPPPRNTSRKPALRVSLPHPDQQALEMAEDFDPQQADGGDMAKILLAQSQALTSLVSQIAMNSGDPLQDLASSSAGVSSRGASGRAKLQQELSAHKGTFFTAVMQSMARRMAPALPVDQSMQDLRIRGVTATQYLERFGGYGKVKDIGMIAWQVALLMDFLQEENWLAARDATALLMVCLEQTAMDAGRMEVGLLLSLTEEPPQSVFSNRTLATGGRPRAFAPLADQKWVTNALQYLKELDTISSRRSEATGAQAKSQPLPKDQPNPKKKSKGKGGGKNKQDKDEDAEWSLSCTPRLYEDPW